MREAFDVTVARGGRALERSLMNAFEKEDSSFVSGDDESLGRS